MNQARGCDEIFIADIGATPEGRGPNFKLIEKLTAKCFVPLCIGGGVRSVEDVRDLLSAGADKVAMCTTQFHTRTLEEAAAKFGKQAIVMAVDVKDNLVYSSCGTARWNMKPSSFARMCAEDGAGEILLTSISHEGLMQGYDLDLIRDVSSAVTVPVVAHGGCGTAQHALEAIRAGASAVAAGAMFQFSDVTPRGVARYLTAAGVEARV